ncbi:hypothetical protein [Pseudofrankia sp. BMG5.36]|uniref:hypothetical protein n=1 Tax=Pseudofrankia sp. BMG5.36 TaxID=1834512 RepID=UPI0008D91139|nr:hypothetical protein [Pseudofrankia sp. BMG5.36]OHV45414.1 hypothetical protein BCD48_01600 [Pseudofrankia sp. BMG5.36]
MSALRRPEDWDISPQSIASFLGTSGWTLQNADEAKEIWGLSENGSPRARLLLPLDPTYIDYDIRFQEAVERLCRVFDWDVEELTANVLSARTDVVLIRTDQAMQDESIPLVQARDVISGAVDMMEAAARASLEPRAQYVGQRPNAVRDFVDGDVRMGHTQRGSFVVTVLTRLAEDDVIHTDEFGDAAEAPRSQRGRAWTVPAARAGNGIRQYAQGPSGGPAMVRIPPFQRRVMATLALALSETRDLSLRQTADADLDLAVSRGVSANLCESLLTMTRFEGLRALDVSFRWAPAEAVPPPTVNQVVFDRDVIAGIGAIGRSLRRAPEKVKSTIYGRVTRLERGEDDDDGVVTISGVVGRSTRRTVRIPVRGEQYDLAIVAHRQRQPVTVTGELRKVKNTYTFDGPVVIEYS